MPHSAVKDSEIISVSYLDGMCVASIYTYMYMIVKRDSANIFFFHSLPDTLKTNHRIFVLWKILLQVNVLITKNITESKLSGV